MIKMKFEVPPAFAQVFDRAADRAAEGSHFEAVIKEIEDVAKSLVPVLTGELRNSIKVEIRKTKRGISAKVGSAEPHAARIEFGFMGVDKLGRRYHQGARPYLRPALDPRRDKLKAASLQDVQDAFK